MKPSSSSSSAARVSVGTVPSSSSTAGGAIHTDAPSSSSSSSSSASLLLASSSSHPHLTAAPSSTSVAPRSTLPGRAVAAPSVRSVPAALAAAAAAGVDLIALPLRSPVQPHRSAAASSSSSAFADTISSRLLASPATPAAPILTSSSLHYPGYGTYSVVPADREAAEWESTSAGTRAAIARMRLEEEELQAELRRMTEQVGTQREELAAMVEDERTVKESTRSRRSIETASRQRDREAASAATLTAAAAVAAPAVVPASSPPRTDEDRKLKARFGAEFVRRFSIAAGAGGSGHRPPAGGDGGDSSDSSNTDISDDDGDSSPPRSSAPASAPVPPSRVSSREAEDADDKFFNENVRLNLQPWAIPKWDGTGMPLSLSKWQWEVRRQARTQLLKLHYPSHWRRLEAVLLSSFSPTVYDWYVMECDVRDNSGKPELSIDSYEKFELLFKTQYEDPREQQLALEEWHGTAMSVRANETVMVYMNRIIAFRPRLCETIVPQAAFMNKIERAIHSGLTPLYAGVVKFLHQRKKLGLTPTLHELRVAMEKITLDNGIKSVLATAPKAPHSASSKPSASSTAPNKSKQHNNGNNTNNTNGGGGGHNKQKQKVTAITLFDEHGDVDESSAAYYKLRCHQVEAKLGEERKNNGTKVRGRAPRETAAPAAAVQVNAVAATPARPTPEGKDPTFIFYNQYQCNKLRAAGRCFKCGEVNHTRRDCPNKTKDLTAELGSGD